METQEFLTKGIGTIETQLLKPAKVKIAAIELKTTKNDGEKMKTPLVIIKCKHPDQQELIDFSKVKVLRGENIKVLSLWAQLDADGNIQKSSALSDLLQFMKVTQPSELYSLEIDTIEQSKEDKYLCLKAY